MANAEKTSAIADTVSSAARLAAAFAGDAKPWYQSATIQSGITTVIASGVGVANAYTGHDVDPTIVATFAATLIAGLGSIFGRLRAAKPIRGRVQ